MATAKYILSPGATGSIHTAPLLKKSGVKKTCFTLDAKDSLDQEDLQFLLENKYTDMIIKVEPVEAKEVKKSSSPKKD